MRTTSVKILQSALRLLGLIAVTGVLRAQDVAPASLTGLFYAALIDRIPDIEPNDLPSHRGVFIVDGLCFPTFGFSTERRPYSWTKTSRNAGTLAMRLPVRGGPNARLEITFTSAMEGTFRQQVDGTAQIYTGQIFFSAAPPDPLPPLTNVSTRARVAAGQAVTAGFVVEGAAPRRVLVRAVGPTLAQFGVANPAANPALTVFRGSVQIAANSGWGGASALAAIFADAGAFALPTSSRDSAVLLTLEAGDYTAQARDANGGEVLIEVYVLN